MSPAKPVIPATTHPLSFDKLSAADFEYLCLWLVEREGYERPEHLGASGGEQGRDSIAWKGKKLVAFQSKRVRNFGPKDAAAEAEKIVALPKKDQPYECFQIVE